MKKDPFCSIFVEVEWGQEIKERQTLKYRGCGQGVEN